MLQGKFPLLIALSLFLTSPIQSKPCSPTDPTNSNPTNYCPIFPVPGVSADSFMTGGARPIRELPTVANPAGAIIISPQGYYSEIKTKGTTRSVKTSSGQEFIFTKTQ